MQTPFKQNDIFANFDEYLKTRDPNICRLYSEYDQISPEKHVMKALDRIPWHKIRGVTKDYVIDCLKLQQTLLGFGAIERANKIDKIAAAIESDFVPSNFNLEDDGVELSRETVMSLPQPLSETSLVVSGDSGLRWSMYRSFRTG
jgi:hypothetical protein